MQQVGWSSVRGTTVGAPINPIQKADVNLWGYHAAKRVHFSSLSQLRAEIYNFSMVVPLILFLKTSNSMLGTWRGQRGFVSIQKMISLMCGIELSEERLVFSGVMERPPKRRGRIQTVHSGMFIWFWWWNVISWVLNQVTTEEFIRKLQDVHQDKFTKIQYRYYGQKC